MTGRRSYPGASLVLQTAPALPKRGLTTLSNSFIIL